MKFYEYDPARVTVADILADQKNPNRAQIRQARDTVKMREKLQKITENAEKPHFSRGNGIFSAALIIQIFSLTAALAVLVWLASL